MHLTWPKYFANKPILTASLTGIAIAAVGLAWVVVLMAVLYGLDQIFPSGGGAGFSLLDGFVIAPIVFIAGLPWSLEADLGGANTAWTIGVMVASFLLNGLLVGFVIGVVKSLASKRRHSSL